MLFTDHLPAAFRLHDDLLYPALSFAVAFLASYIALDFTRQLQRGERMPQHFWSFACALLIGIAIWCLHFIGISAFNIGVLGALIFSVAAGALRVTEKMADHLKEQMGRRMAELEQANEDLFRAKETAESASIAKSEFLANMSHEIRTPMNAVIGITHILRNNMVPPEKKDEFLATLQTSAESLLALLNEILDISKIEANKIQLEHISFNLRDLIEEIIAVIAIRADEKGLALKVNYDMGCGTFFYGDPLRLRQILVNLLSNAVKFTDHGTVTLAIRCDAAPEYGDEKNIEIHVKDTGIGINDEKIKDIFEKFIQADTTTTRKYGGTGLGLAICKALTEKMGGRLHVVSTPGQGSDFIVSLPLAPDAKQNVVAAEETSTQPETSWIMLVDDSSPNIMVASSYLETLGYAYEVAHNGLEAMALYRKRKFAVILLDIHMPELDGFDVTRAIREKESESEDGRYTPIIALTSFATMHDREKCLRHGMDEYISKPFHIDELQSKIDYFVRLQQQNS